MKNQINSLNIFLTKHKKTEFKIENITISTTLNCSVFKSLDKDELINYIQQNNRKLDFKDIVEISNNVNGFIDITEHLQKSLEDKYKKYLDGTSEKIKLFNQCLEDFTIEFRNYGIEIEKEIGCDPINDVRFKPVYELYKTEIKSKESTGINPFTLKKGFYKPLSEFLSTIRLEPKTVPLSKIVTKSVNVIRSLEFEKDYIEKNITSLNERHKEQRDKLRKLIKEIENN